jgi:hypothetical protein
VPLERILTDTRILDVLLHNSDRHHGHLLHGEHWAIRSQVCGRSTACVPFGVCPSGVVSFSLSLSLSLSLSHQPGSQ